MRLDYLQNIELKEKNQVQSAHYCGKQQSLHNTILQYPKNGPKIHISTFR